MSPASAPRPSWAILAMAAAAIAVLGWALPFAGFVGIVVVLIARRAVRRDARGGKVALVLGHASLAVGALWVVVFLEPPRIVPRGSCPSVESLDRNGKEHLEASMLAGALYPWAERRDVDRLLRLEPIKGEYRIRIRGGREEIGHLDSVALLIVDHEAGTEILSTDLGKLVAVRNATQPLRALQGRGTWTIEFPRPEGPRALLVLRARMTDFAEDAFARYMAAMGQGIGPFMERVTGEDCSESCRREVMDDEGARLGIPLVISTGGATVKPRLVGAIGPAVVRRFAVPIEVPAGEGHFTIRLGCTPRFWELEGAELAADPAGEITPQVLAPRTAKLLKGNASDDVLADLAEDDLRRIALRTLQIADVRFAAPPLARGKIRASFVAVRGYEEIPVGGHRLVDTWRVLAHRAGLVSLPRFAEGL